MTLPSRVRPALRAILVATGFVLGAPGVAWAAEHGLASTRDPVSQGIVATIIVAVFVMLALEKAHRVLVVFCAVALLWLITYLTPYHLISFEASQAEIDLNVIILLASMMAVVGVLKSTGVFTWAVARLLQLSGGKPFLLTQILIWFTGLISALADNVTTVVFTTPMAIQLAREIRIPVAAFLLPMVMAANIGGTATLIGDPPNILIGSRAGLSFGDFVVNLTIPVLAMMAMLVWFTKSYYAADYAAGRQSLAPDEVTVPRLRNRPLLNAGLVIAVLIFVGFFTHPLTGMPAAVPAAIGAALMLVVQDVFYLRVRDASFSERVHGILHVIEGEIEWPTLSFFAFLFIAVGAAVQTGLIDTLSHGLVGFIEWGRHAAGLSDLGTLLFASLLILWVSGILSALIDNIPYVAVVIPIIGNLAGQLSGETSVLWWALALGACLGGNGSVIGASANVTVVGLAEKAESPISFAAFARFGTRVTALTLLMSSVFLAGEIYLGHLVTQAASLGVAGVLFFGSRYAGRRRTATG
jgi:Na+/H+ antiporter NhaD/arsenite permease-like protein